MSQKSNLLTAVSEIRYDEIPHSSAVKHLRCGGIFIGDFYNFTAECLGKHGSHMSCKVMKNEERKIRP